MARFLPGLRNKTAPPVEYGHPFGALTPEGKQLITNYYSSLSAAAAAATVSRRTRPWDVQRAVAEGYERIVWVFKAVEVIAGNASRLPVKIMEGDQEVLDHPLAQLLNGPAANPLESGPQLRKRLSAQVLLSRAGAFVEVTSSRRGNLTRVDLLPPHRTRPIPGDSDNPIAGYEVTDIHGRLRTIPPDRVRWFREPHPIDPYLGITPLEASGLSVEVDFFARLYNAQFLNNDSRPGGILAVRGPGNTAGLSPAEVAKLEARFGPGPTEAGKMSVISGDMTYLDTASSPRDMHYTELAKNMKVEILTAFGLDESIVGDTSGRTFSNAEQAWQNFWLLDPMPSHLDLLATGWSKDTEPSERITWDTEGVEPLQRAKSAKLEEARAEVAAGLRSIASYAKIAGYADDVPDTPQMHAFWVAQGRTPIPGRAEDAKALGFADDGGAVADASGQAVGPAKDVAAIDPDAVPAPAAAPAEDLPQLPGAPGQRSAADIVDAAGTRSAADIVAAAGTKASAAERNIGGRDAAVPSGPRVRVIPAPSEPPATHEASPDALAAVEAELGEALAALAERFAERTAARVGSPKTRKGTPHFAAEFAQDTRVGDNALDTAKAVDEETWAAETEQAASPILTAAAVAAALALLASLGEGEDSTAGERVRDLAVRAARASVRAVVESARKQAQRLVNALSERDAAGLAIQELQAVARGWGDGPGKSWAQHLATFGAVSVTHAAEAEAIQDLIDQGKVTSTAVRRTWRTRRDLQVRPTHRSAEGQTVGVGAPFVVGDALLRFPGDPLAPMHETAGCRCSVAWSVTGAGARRRRGGLAFRGLR